MGAIAAIEYALDTNGYWHLIDMSQICYLKCESEQHKMFIECE